MNDSLLGHLYFVDECVMKDMSCVVNMVTVK